MDRCHECNEVIPAGVRFCTHCGKPISKAGAPPSSTREGPRASSEASPERPLDAPDKKALDQFRRANEAAGRQDWEAAVDGLRKARGLAQSSAPSDWEKFLAIALTNLGIEKVNRAVRQLHDSSEERKQRLDAMFRSRTAPDEGGNQPDLPERLPFLALSDLCTHCAQSEGVAEVKSPAGDEARLCRDCLEELQALQGPPTPDDKTIDLLEAGKRDLAEATDLDPANAHAQQQFGQVFQLLTKLRHAAAASAEAARQRREVNKAVDLFRQAHDAAGRQAWQEAVDRLRDAIAAAPGEPPQDWQRFLSLALTSLGIEQINQAVKELQDSEFSIAIAELLMSGKKHLEEAAQADPSNAHAQSQLEQADRLLSQLADAHLPRPQHSNSDSSRKASGGSKGKPKAGWFARIFRRK
ncbi:MAG: zinc ribbon domain-containing protein [Phycisphaerae bacterium]|nr:zinc ribbon domain-containing protein [Phycisphaerae bacterium]